MNGFHSIHYQAYTISSSFYRGHGRADEEEFNYLVTSLAGEAGELANEWKKVIREPRVHYNLNFRNRAPKMVKELGDIQWYVARMAAAFGITPEELMIMNTAKLCERHNDPWPYQILSLADALKLTQHIESRITHPNANTSTDTDMLSTPSSKEPSERTELKGEW